MVTPTECCILRKTIKVFRFWHFRFEVFPNNSAAWYHRNHKSFCQADLFINQQLLMCELLSCDRVLMYASSPRALACLLAQ